MKPPIQTIVAAVVLVPIVVYLMLSGDWPNVTLMIALAVLLVSGDLRARWAYTEGWHRGRAEMFLSAAEAANRGMSPIDWLEAESERTIKNRKGL